MIGLVLLLENPNLAKYPWWAACGPQAMFLIVLGAHNSNAGHCY